MTLYEFNRLDSNSKYHTISEKAIFVGERTEGWYEYSLFQLHSFYIESRFHILKQTLDGIKTISYMQVPDAYLTQIDLGLLL